MKYKDFVIKLLNDTKRKRTVRDDLKEGQILLREMDYFKGKTAEKMKQAASRALWLDCENSGIKNATYLLATNKL